MGARSELTRDITTANKCWQMVADMVTYVNGTSNDDGKSNPFNKAKGSLCDGIHAASDSSDIVIPRGGTVVYCDGLDTVAHKIKLANNINIRRCTCTESDCTLTTDDRRCVVRIDQAVTSSSTTLSFALQSYSPSGCIDTNTTQLKVSGKTEPLSVSSCNSTSCNVSNAYAIDNSTLLYEDDPAACYYPFGFASTSLFFTALDNHTAGKFSNASNYERHICE